MPMTRACLRSGPPFSMRCPTLAAPSITEAVRALVIRDAAEIVDCSDLDWIDVDDPKALAAAEAFLGVNTR